MGIRVNLLIHLHHKAFASAYFRMSMLGVNNMNSLKDCTNVLPLPR